MNKMIIAKFLALNHSFAPAYFLGHSTGELRSACGVRPRCARKPAKQGGANEWRGDLG